MRRPTAVGSGDRPLTTSALSSSYRRSSPSRPLPIPAPRSLVLHTRPPNCYIGSSSSSSTSHAPTPISAHRHTQDKTTEMAMKTARLAAPEFGSQMKAIVINSGHPLRRSVSIVTQNCCRKLRMAVVCPDDTKQSAKAPQLLV